MNRVNDDELGLLQQAVCKYLAEKIASGEASASDVANAIKLLKDNNITSVPNEGDELAGLREQLGTKPVAALSSPDLEQALAELDWGQARAN